MWTTLKHRSAVNHNLSETFRVTQLKFRAFDVPRLRTCVLRSKIALDLLGIKCTNPAILPRRRKLFAWLKSPFKWKKHQELWEFRTYTRCMTFEADVLATRQALDFIYSTLYPGVGLRVKRLSFEPLEKWYKNPYAHIAEIERGDRLRGLRRSHENKVNWSGLERVSSFTGTVKHMARDGTLVTVFSKNQETPDFTEPEVEDADIVFDDSYYRFDTTKYTIIEDEMNRRIHELVSLCRAKAKGEDVDYLDLLALKAIAEARVAEEIALEKKVKSEEVNE
eukprot:TRINITY_DN12523_c0_g1_i1.p1 TRINITY_DN12523_c0_g1~~TRINITY_DN12523_c0_g1_i1.p1  ORF type:complete len:279 (-),score=33.00 TRINITY_DN12523_c0_g1_i1:160-996(-)